MRSIGLTAETQELLRQRKGYRCGKPLETRPSAVVASELKRNAMPEDLAQYCEPLALQHCSTDTILDELCKLDPTHEAIWLATEAEAREHYCDGQDPDEYAIPEDALVLQDMPDGTLFLWRRSP